MFLEPMLEPNCSCRNSTAQQLKVLIATVGLDTAVTACGSAVVNAFGLWTWKILENQSITSPNTPKTLAGMFQVSILRMHSKTPQATNPCFWP